MASRLTFLNTKKTPTYFQGAIKPTRFDNCGRDSNIKELTDAAELVEQIRKKVDELSNDPESKRGETPGYDKSTVMSTLLVDLDACIISFNRQNQQMVLKDELREVSHLIAQLINAVKKTLNDKDAKKTIETKRNNHKELARKGSDIGLIGGAAALSLTGPFLWGVAYCLGGLGVSTLIKKYAHLNELDTASSLMVNKLDETLKDVRVKVELELKPLASESQSSSPSPIN